MMDERWEAQSSPSGLSTTAALLTATRHATTRPSLGRVIAEVGDSAPLSAIGDLPALIALSAVAEYYYGGWWVR